MNKLKYQLVFLLSMIPNPVFAVSSTIMCGVPFILMLPASLFFAFIVPNVVISTIISRKDKKTEDKFLKVMIKYYFFATVLGSPLLLLFSITNLKNTIFLVNLLFLIPVYVFLYIIVPWIFVKKHFLSKSECIYYFLISFFSIIGLLLALSLCLGIQVAQCIKENSFDGKGG